MKKLYSILFIVLLWTLPSTAQTAPFHTENFCTSSDFDSDFYENDFKKVKKMKGVFGVNISGGFGLQILPVFDAAYIPSGSVGIDLYVGYKPLPWLSLRFNVNVDLPVPTILPTFSAIPTVAFLFGKRWKTIVNVGIGAGWMMFYSYPIFYPILKLGIEGRHTYASGFFLGIGGDLELQWFFIPLGRIRFTIGHYF